MVLPPPFISLLLRGSMGYSFEENHSRNLAREGMKRQSKFLTKLKVKEKRIHYSDCKVARTMLFDRSRNGSKDNFIGINVAFSKADYYALCRTMYLD